MSKPFGDNEVTRRQALRRFAGAAVAMTTASILPISRSNPATASSATPSQPRRGGTLAIGTDTPPVELGPLIVSCDIHGPFDV